METSGGSVRTIAVVGGGPRGIAAVERILANVAEIFDGALKVLLFEPHSPGGGRIWDSGQPRHLLMNTLCADATHFTDDTVEIRGPVRPGPTLYEWARKIVSGEVVDLGSPENALDSEHHEEAAQMLPHSHPSRRFLGGYLEWCFRTDVRNAPSGVTVEHVGTVVEEIEPEGSGWRLWAQGADPCATEGASAEGYLVDAVILAVGHSDNELPRSRRQSLGEAAEAAGLWYGPPSSPISQHGLDEVGAGETVVVRGLGMNFFDYLSLFTRGRGGEFRQSSSGEDALEYLPSGLEPKLVVGSRRGVPYRAKGRFGRMTPTFPRRYMTRELVDALMSSVAEGSQVDFTEDLLPAVLDDAALLYYSVLERQFPEAFTGSLEELTAALDEFGWGAPEFDEVTRKVIPEEKRRFDVRRLDRPLEGAEFDTPSELRQWWLEDLRADIREANAGMNSALKCSSVQIGAGRAPLRTLVRYGGVKGESYRDDIEGWFRGFAGMLASGPPATRIDELIALVEAGVVQPLGAEMEVAVKDSSFVASSPSVPGHVYRAKYLLEAHLPSANFSRASNPVLRSLREHGRARAYVARNGSHHSGVVTGAMEVGPPPYRVVSRDGVEQAGLYAVGVPLEGIHWGTQLQPLAKTNSRFLREIDAAARDALCPGIDGAAPGEPEADETPHGEESA